MHFLSSVLFASTVAAVPFTFPLPNGFPNPDQNALTTIQKDAQGTIPTDPLPTKVSAKGISALKLIAQNEIFEVGYFTSLYNNVTQELPGYCPDEYKPLTKDYIMRTLKAIIAQEEEHALGVQAALKSAGATPVNACSFKFPVTKFGDAIALAATFTDLVLSVLPQAQDLFATDGGDELGFVPLFGSVLAQEGEQDGFFRALGLKTPSAAPFLTQSAPDFAFNALSQTFVVSCPDDLSALGFKKFDALSIVQTNLQPVDQQLTFTTTHAVDASKNSIVYLTGLKDPVTVKIDSVSQAGGAYVVKAQLPFASQIFSNGLTVAALMDGTGSFPDVPSVVAKTLAGPGLVEVQ